jgi:hypothetical protein
MTIIQKLEKLEGILENIGLTNCCEDVTSYSSHLYSVAGAYMVLLKSGDTVNKAGEDFITNWVDNAISEMMPYNPV